MVRSLFARFNASTMSSYICKWKWQLYLKRKQLTFQVIALYFSGRLNSIRNIFPSTNVRSPAVSAVGDCASFAAILHSFSAVVPSCAAINDTYRRFASSYKHFILSRQMPTLTWLTPFNCCHALYFARATKSNRPGAVPPQSPIDAYRNEQYEKSYERTNLFIKSIYLQFNIVIRFAFEFCQLRYRRRELIVEWCRRIETVKQ